MRPTRRGIIFAHASQAFAWLLFYDRIRVALPRALRLSHRVRSFLVISQQRAWATVGSSRSALGGRRVVPQRRVWSAVGSSRNAEPEPSRSDHPAVSNLHRARVIPQRRIFAASRSSRSADSRSPRPRHRPEVVAGRLKTKKTARIATFLRLGIVMDPPDRKSRCKSAGNRLFSSLFPL